MKWLTRLLGVSEDGSPPEYVQQALDSAAKATEATDTAHDAVLSYWRARRSEQEADLKLRFAKVDASLENERQGRRK